MIAGWANIKQLALELGSRYIQPLEQIKLKDFQEEHRTEDHLAGRQHRVLVRSHRSGTMQPLCRGSQKYIEAK